ncbi:TonB-dependent receptor [Gemmatimonas phototrophica]|uniref:TonB-dependent receptor n=1 Tax=Gemmatimonas phototrophica TaxID=1379270 RepID=UPI0004787B67|nr:TonB-dependent receptor [Gemmatimonas phototrophica]
MSRFCLPSVALGAALLLLPAATAQAQGTLAGTVVDSASGLSLTGASISIASISRTVQTDRSGRFIVPAVAAGEYALTARYLGYTAATLRVRVENGKTATANFKLSAAKTQLGEVVVVATRTGQAAALNQQKAATTVGNVIAADQIGRFPDANLGDALKRIPGVTVALDQGEARFGSIRGTEPRFNSVLVNGERVPSAEAEVREVQLDLVPADMVQAVEVSKTLTPDMDADAIGGAVNVVTRAAPAGFRLSTTVGSGYNFIREKPVVVGGVVAGNRFFDNRLGVIGSASYFDQQFGSDNKEGTWDRTSTGSPYMNQFDLRRYDVQRTRRSASLGLDYKFNEANTIMWRSLYNSRDDWENRFRARYILGAPNASGIQNTEIRRQTKGGGPDPRVKATRLEDQRMWSSQLSGEHLIANKATLTWSGSMAAASETRPDERYIDWRSRNVSIQPNYTDQQNPQFSATNPAQVAPTAFTFRRIEQLESFTEDRDMNGRIDLLLPLREGEKASRLKFGARYRGKEKLRDNSYNFATPVTGSAFANLGLTGSGDYTVDNNLAGNYAYGTFSTPEYLSKLDLFNSSQFRLADQPGEYAAGNFDAEERVTGGYGMLEQLFGNGLSLIAGVRVENTNIDYRGFQYNVDNDAVSPTTGSQTYTDVLPSVNVRWEQSRNTVFRAAWTNTLARPNYFDLVPYREISLEDNELATGNPNLKPTRAMNFDFMAERYFENVGLLSAGVFHKRITDFIFNFTQFQARDAVTGQTFSQISTPRNGPEATLTGIEVAAQRQLDFLPGILRYLGVYANYTFNESEVSGLDIEGRENEKLPLLGTAKHSGNLSLSFDSKRFTARVAMNYQSESLDAGEGGYNEDAFFDRWADRRTDIDANATFQITSKSRFFLDANNLNNRPLRYFQGNRGRLMQDEFYGRRIQTGFKFDF